MCRVSFERISAGEDLTVNPLATFPIKISNVARAPAYVGHLNGRLTDRRLTRVLSGLVTRRKAHLFDPTNSPMYLSLRYRHSPKEDPTACHHSPRTHKRILCHQEIGFRQHPRVLKSTRIRFDCLLVPEYAAELSILTVR